MKTNEGTLIEIHALVGRKDVNGLLVDLRTRINGEIEYVWEDKPVIAKLKRVYWKYNKLGIHKIKWLYWEWYTTDLDVSYKCGFSGTSNPIDIQKFQLLVVDPDFKL